MKQTISKLQIVFVVLALISTAANPLPLASTKKDFELSSTYGDRDSFEASISESGCVIAQIKSWSSSRSGEIAASKLALILNGSDRVEYYARSDGSATSIVPLWTSYSVSSTQISKVKKWTISVVNFTKNGSAKGTFYLEYPPALTPCELKVATSKTRGKVDLSWVYTGKSFRGSFLVERTTDGKTWKVVSSCKKSAPSATTSSMTYSCSDTGLNSGTIYYYRACAITSGTACDTDKYITPPRAVKAP